MGSTGKITVRQKLLLVVKVVRVVFLYVLVESAGENFGDLSETNVGDKTCRYYDR